MYLPKQTRIIPTGLDEDNLNNLFSWTDKERYLIEDEEHPSYTPNMLDISLPELKEIIDANEARLVTVVHSIPQNTDDLKQLNLVYAALCHQKRILYEKETLRSQEGVVVPGYWQPEDDRRWWRTNLTQHPMQYSYPLLPTSSSQRSLPFNISHTPPLNLIPLSDDRKWNRNHLNDVSGSPKLPPSAPPEISHSNSLHSSSQHPINEDSAPLSDGEHRPSIFRTSLNAQLSDIRTSFSPVSPIHPPSSERSNEHS